MTYSPPPFLASGIPRPSPHTPYHPHADQATYRDLLLFEERLKMNAEMLRKRRRRYSAFLWSFVGLLAWLSHRLVFLPPSSMVELRALQASVAVVLITLVLFFASGMYEEKIRYAHAYINHSNKALRPLNMHLNTRRPSPYLSFPFLSGSLKTTPLASTAVQQPAAGSGTRKASSVTMPAIPPSSNPRGELIFSYRVDKHFREGYERYRAAFERRREEKAKEDARRNARWFRRMGGRGGSRSSTPTPPTSRRGTPPPGSLRGRTPSPGRSKLRHSLDLSAVQAKIAQAQKETDPDRNPERQTALDALDVGGRTRAESYSFVLEKESASSK